MTEVFAFERYDRVSVPYEFDNKHILIARLVSDPPLLWRPILSLLRRPREELHLFDQGVLIYQVRSRREATPDYSWMQMPWSDVIQIDLQADRPELRYYENGIFREHTSTSKFGSDCRRAAADKLLASQESGTIPSRVQIK